MWRAGVHVHGTSHKRVRMSEWIRICFDCVRCHQQLRNQQRRLWQSFHLLDDGFVLFFVFIVGFFDILLQALASARARVRQDIQAQPAKTACQSTLASPTTEGVAACPCVRPPVRK